MVTVGVSTDGAHVSVNISGGFGAKSPPNPPEQRVFEIFETIPNVLSFYFYFFLRQHQRKTSEKDFLPDTELPEPVRRRRPSHTLHCQKGKR